MILVTTSIGGVIAMLAIRRQRAASAVAEQLNVGPATDGVQPGVEGGEPAP